MAQVKYNQYNPLRMKLLRLKVDSAAKVATILLDAFVQGEGYLWAKDFYAAGLGGNFKTWIDELKQLKILGQVFPDDGAPRKELARYFAGPAIAPYVNAERALRTQFASEADLHRTEGRVEKLEDEVRHLKDRMTKMEEAIIYVEKADPPVTLEKVQKRVLEVTSANGRTRHYKIRAR